MTLWQNFNFSDESEDLSFINVKACQDCSVVLPCKIKLIPQLEKVSNPY